jgi:hypothetical protein
MSVVLLVLDESGADTTTTFVDGSASAHTVTTNGNFQWDTAQAPSGLSSSGLSDGTGDYLSIAAHANFALGTGDFTIEGWARYSDNSGTQHFIDLRTSGGNNAPLIYSDGSLIRFHADTSTLISTTIPSTGSWFHFAFTRASNVGRAFINGTQVGGDQSLTDTMGDTTETCFINASESLGGGIKGWLASIRVDKGTALYTANFTPPSLPLGDYDTYALSGSGSTGGQTAPAVSHTIPL